MKLIPVPAADGNAAPAGWAHLSGLGVAQVPALVADSRGHSRQQFGLLSPHVVRVVAEPSPLTTTTDGAQEDIRRHGLGGTYSG
ncbi:MAG: hypothetical protein LC121_04870 [Anaerolineae bacterium]|nr:hypothetical protein [Anaerolineae bacterium]